jgi:hypothetical protein
METASSTIDSPETESSTDRPVDERHVRRLRSGHGANCSSIGSVIDTLFATATVGAAVFAAVLAALRSEEVRVVKPPEGDAQPPAGNPGPAREDA